MSIERYSMHERQETHIDALPEDDGLWVYYADHEQEVAALCTALSAAREALTRIAALDRGSWDEAPDLARAALDAGEGAA